jgi:pyruvate dehydrogenase E2 component (dihydrolipoamide acetyltransferase)
MSADAVAGIYEFRMPSLGADMENGTLLEWRVAPGDTVRRGDIVALVDTEKAEVEVEIFAAGIVEELIVREGQEVPVGALLARVRTGAAPARTAPAPAAMGQPAAAVSPPQPPPAAAVHAAPIEPRPTPQPGAVALPRPVPVTTAVRPPASPSARRRARELGIDLTTVTASGRSGGITRLDVEAVAARATRTVGAVEPATAESAVAAPAPTPAATPHGEPARPERPRGLRRALATAMERSNREIPHYYLTSEVDLQPARSWLDRANQERSIADRLLPAVLFLKAIALAAREVPEMNGFWIDGTFRPGTGIHLGVAISRREGEVVVPAIHDVDRLSVDELMRALRDLVKRARAGSLRSSELTDATLTVTNLGELGVAAVLGVIYPPQVALVGVGRIVERPRAVGGMLAVRPTATFSLAADHRASDGYRGARFLNLIDDLLQKPEAL